WFMEQQLDAKSLASDVRIQQAIIDLTILGQTPGVTQAELAKSAAARTLQLYLKPLLEARDYLDFVVVGADKRILASPRRGLITHAAPPGYNQFVEKALDGNV